MSHPYLSLLAVLVLFQLAFVLVGSDLEFLDQLESIILHPFRLGLTNNEFLLLLGFGAPPTKGCK